MANKNFHQKPRSDERSVNEALRYAECLRHDLPQVAQVFARNWDPIILADEIYTLREKLKILFEKYPEAETYLMLMLIGK